MDLSKSEYASFMLPNPAWQRALFMYSWGFVEFLEIILSKSDIEFE